MKALIRAAVALNASVQASARPVGSWKKPKPQPAHDPDAPGPFAFADPDGVRSILERADFAEIEITARDEQVGSGDLDTMLLVCSRVGALGRILRENPGAPGRDAAGGAVCTCSTRWT